MADTELQQAEQVQQAEQALVSPVGATDMANLRAKGVHENSIQNAKRAADVIADLVGAELVTEAELDAVITHAFCVNYKRCTAAKIPTDTLAAIIKAPNAGAEMECLAMNGKTLSEMETEAAAKADAAKAAEAAAAAEKQSAAEKAAADAAAQPARSAMWHASRRSPSPRTSPRTHSAISRTVTVTGGPYFPACRGPPVPPGRRKLAEPRGPGKGR